MASGFVIRKNQYYDSVFLMGISKRISDVSGVRQNAVLMGSDANKTLLAQIGIAGHEIDVAQPNDLVVGVIADTADTIDVILHKLDEFLLGGIQAASTSNPHSLEEALAIKPQANLAVISVPGEYAAHEARKALDAGLNVFLFSDNVSAEDELQLKQLACQKGLLCMGPDCGTAIIGGTGLGFANQVRRGRIGVIGVAGTGLQEFTSAVHNAGLGISHAIGTGGHDVSDAVGGLTTFAALQALEADPHTDIIAVISKPPGAATHARLMARFASCPKPVVICFLGTCRNAAGARMVHLVATIDDAVHQVVELSGASAKTVVESSPGVTAERATWAKGQKYLRGLLAGGTFCYQTQQILRDAGLEVHSNAPLEAKFQLADSNCSVRHTIVDLGADEYTVGRPHPMIDGTLRKQRILAESHDPEVAILLLDFILGYNASMDPVGDLLDAIVQAKQVAAARGDNLTVVASVCGTDGDGQDMALQMKMLREAGAIVFRSNASAASFCANLLTVLGGS